MFFFVIAPCILRMLQYVLKEEIFLEGIKVYMKKQWSNLDDFWDLMQSVLDKQQNTDRGYISLKNLMDPWVKKKQYPVLKSHTELNSNMKKLNVIMENMSGTFKIPVTYIRLPKPNFHNILPKFWIYFKSVVRLTFVFPYVTWLLLNLQQTGYYRVNYQKNDLLEIGGYLHTKNYTNIHVLNRAQIIDDTFHFVTTGEFDSPATFWYLVAYLHQELDYIAWYPMFKAMERMSFIIPFNESIHFKTKILGLLRPLLQKIGYEEFNIDEDDLTKCLKQEAVKWACVLGDIECKKMAERKLEWHLSNKTSNYLLPWWRKWTYCNGLSISTTSFSKVFHNLNDIFETNNSKILEYLACTNKTSDIQLAVLGKNLSSENNPRKNIIVRNCISVFFDVILRHAKDKLLHVIISHWEKLN
ncbi:aminopeptidase N-like [Pogonomyrmex barbatus]|uniref:Aminopeptidase N-like n=1 Tax=Pogonomyrmex barbatus TaxID=144034 RepID=A0A6I9WIX8_9HYME|nr:aminopeptidase N-like [Pogonomyrmex barbatus]